MRRMSAIAALVCFSFAAAFAAAQSTSPPAPVESRAPGVAPTLMQGTVPATVAARAHDDVDARACLEFVSNLGVIRCAEKYRNARERPAH